VVLARCRARNSDPEFIGTVKERGPAGASMPRAVAQRERGLRKRVLFGLSRVIAVTMTAAIRARLRVERRARLDDRGAELLEHVAQHRIPLDGQRR
jgi:hypothetical protein